MRKIRRQKTYTEILVFRNWEIITYLLSGIFQKFNGAIKMRVITLLSVFLLIGNIFVQAQHVDANKIEKHEKFLASDLLKGRKPGTRGDELAANYILDHFRNIGLELPLDNGMQYFELVTDVKLGENNWLKLEDSVYDIDKEYVPLSFSGNGELNADLVFAGYGFDIDNEKLQWNDYNQDISGKWIMILRGHPELDSTRSNFDDYSDDRFKVLTARDKHAGGVILVSPKGISEKDKLMKLFYDKSSNDAGIPVINITRKLADTFLAKSKMPGIDSLIQVIAVNRKPITKKLDVSLDAYVQLDKNYVKTQNVVGILESTSQNTNKEYIVIGAHYDHLGMGGHGSGSRDPDTIAVHNGADDNASGVSLIIELARELSKLEERKRSIIFVAFGAEEMGLIGSSWFVKNSPVPVENITAMVNFDMVGRFDTKTKKLSIGGVKSSLEAEELIYSSLDTSAFSLQLTSDGYGPSDHAPFYAANVPVFFVSTGAHSDYHTPFDDVEKLNINGIASIGTAFYPLIVKLINSDDRLTYADAGPKSRSRHGTRFKVTLGIVPDFANKEGKGLGVDGVRKGGPADLGGIKKGDIITALNGMSVKGIYDYMGRLKKLEPGQTITVDVFRNGKTEVLLIQL
ncbi:MAG: hypothetical protein C0594_03025 [Marinilabiliales bacterium]|nr:MAG: hypothetical protein C0594_03025 [Marinilabiliales bacterium]